MKKPSSYPGLKLGCHSCYQRQLPDSQPVHNIPIVYKLHKKYSSCQWKCFCYRITLTSSEYSMQTETQLLLETLCESDV